MRTHGRHNLADGGGEEEEAAIEAGKGSPLAEEGIHLEDEAAIEAEAVARPAQDTLLI